MPLGLDSTSSGARAMRGLGAQCRNEVAAAHSRCVYSRLDAHFLLVVPPVPVPVVLFP